MEHHLFAVDLVLPHEVVRGVVHEVTPDAIPEHFPHPGHRHHRQEHAVRVREVRGVVQGVPERLGVAAVAVALGQHEHAVGRVLQLLWVDGLHHVPVVPAAQVPDAHRPGVDHHGDGAGFQPPGVGDRAVEHLLDPLDLDEVVAPADAPDLTVATEAVVRAHEVR